MQAAALTEPKLFVFDSFTEIFVLMSEVSFSDLQVDR